MSHDHSDHASHDAHDEHSGHNEHDAHGHDEHEETLDEELPPIEPAGFLNDLSIDSGIPPIIDVTVHFPFRETIAINHNPHRVWNDMRVEPFVPVNLSQKLTLSVKNHPTSRLFDLYGSQVFAPTLLSSFSRKAFSPRLPVIDLYPALPDFPDTAVDVRTLELHDLKRLRPDIYALDLPLSRRIRRFRRKHGKKVLKVSSGFAL